MLCFFALPEAPSKEQHCSHFRHWSPCVACTVCFHCAVMFARCFICQALCEPYQALYCNSVDCCSSSRQGSSDLA